MSRAYSSFSPTLNQKNDKSFNFNFSLDVKSYMKRQVPQMSFTNKFKKHQINELNLKSAYSTPISYGNRPKQNSKDVSRFREHSTKNIKEKRRLSLIGNIKHNESQIHQINQIEDQVLLSKYQKIKQLLKNQKYILSITQIKQMLSQVQEKKKRKELYFWLIIALTKSNKFQHAEQFAHKCLSQFPSFYQAIIYLAQINFKLGKIYQAIRSYQKAIIIQQTNSEAYIQLSDVYRSQGLYLKVEEILEQGLEKCLKSITIPIKIIQNLIYLNKTEQVKHYLDRIFQIQQVKTSDYFYAKAIIQQSKQRELQSCIYYQQSIKLNTSKVSVAKSLQNYVNIQIRQRDFYSAYHNIKRCKHLQISFKRLEAYQIFLQGAILIMKKMYEQGIHTLSQFLIKFKQINYQMNELIKKYLAYAFFKLGKHSQAINYYKKLDQKSRDQVSNYNLLLAQGIQYVDLKNDFQNGINKFQQAKIQYSTKVQPFIYIAMTIIKRINTEKIQGEDKYQAVIKALQILDQAETINSSSSNLLYHRAIVFLFFQDYDQAHKDINRCIQKAQQNLPKYFYLRGICYSCVKQLKKATNQFSIAISLDKQYSQAYLERSKCYFLLGQSDRGFQDLKFYMQLQPEDISVHHWIGDLLYEGGSYQDALKAYNQMGNKIDMQTLCMKIKCQLKLGLFKNVLDSIKKIEKQQNYKQEPFIIDKICLQILSSLLNNDSQKAMSNKLALLNKQLQICSSGKIFLLVDCMFLIGISSFYLNRFKQAYQSFCLTLQLYKSLSTSELVIKMNDQQECLSLKVQDIYINLLITILASGDKTEVLRLLKQEMLPIWKNKTQIKFFNRLIKAATNQFLSNSRQTLYIDHRIQNIYSKKMKKTQVCFKSIIIKTSLIFACFHQTIDTLYSNQKARSMINQFHAGYIDNMPQAPWIKRNEYGVVFTDQIIRDQSNCTFLTSDRKQQQNCNQEKDESNQSINEQESNNKKAFLKQMKLDVQIQKNLSKIINKDKKNDCEQQNKQKKCEVIENMQNSKQKSKYK